MEPPHRLDAIGLTEALAALGSILEHRGLAYELVVVGGASLMLAGLVARPTKDADVIGYRPADGSVRRLDTLPPELTEAAAEVAAAYGLDPAWINTQAAPVMQFGLPDGFEERLAPARFGTLTLWLAGRLDQVCFKLHAVVDQWPTPGRHLEDLRALAPTPEELATARDWCAEQDSSEAFRDGLDLVVSQLANEVRNG